MQIKRLRTSNEYLAYQTNLPNHYVLLNVVNYQNNVSLIYKQNTSLKIYIYIYLHVI